MSKVYGYVILNNETREQWGGSVYASKAGATTAYNSHHFKYNPRDDRHKFKDQDKYGMYPVVVADE